MSRAWQRSSRWQSVLLVSVGLSGFALLAPAEAQAGMIPPCLPVSTIRVSSRRDAIERNSGLPNLGGFFASSA